MQQKQEEQQVPVRDEQKVFQYDKENNPPAKAQKYTNALSNFRSSVEKIYTNSKDRSLSRHQENKAYNEYNIEKVLNPCNDELNKFCQMCNNEISCCCCFSQKEKDIILKQAQSSDCYVIKEKMKHQEAKKQIKKVVIQEEVRRTEDLKQISTKKNFTQNKQLTQLPSLPTFKIEDPPTIEIPQDTEKPIQVIWEGGMNKPNKCIKKFAKKIFYLQKVLQDTQVERDIWKSKYESLLEQYNDLEKRYQELLDLYNMETKKYRETVILYEKYKVIANALEDEIEELRKQKHFVSGHHDVEIQEKIIEKPVEIIKHVILEKIVEKPIETIKTVQSPPIYVEKKIEVPVEVVIEKIVEKIIEVPKEIIVERMIEVPKIQYVDREKIVEVKVPEYIEKLVEVPMPVHIEHPPQLVKEYVEIKDQQADRELQFVWEDYRKLQNIHQNVLFELNTLTEKYSKLQSDYDNFANTQFMQYEQSRNKLIEEIKLSHSTIDDMRDKVEQLYREISILTEQNNNKNIELNNHIRYLEDYIATYIPQQNVVRQVNVQQVPVYYTDYVINDNYSYYTGANVYSQQQQQVNQVQNQQYSQVQNQQQYNQVQNQQYNQVYQQQQHQQTSKAFIEL